MSPTLQKNLAQQAVHLKTATKPVRFPEISFQQRTPKLDTPLKLANFQSQLPSSSSQVGQSGIFVNNELSKHHQDSSGKQLTLSFKEKNKQQLAKRHLQQQIQINSGQGNIVSGFSGNNGLGAQHMRQRMFQQQHSGGGQVVTDTSKSPHRLFKQSNNNYPQAGN